MDRVVVGLDASVLGIIMGKLEKIETDIAWIKQRHGAKEIEIEDNLPLTIETQFDLSSPETKSRPLFNKLPSSSYPFQCTICLVRHKDIGTALQHVQGSHMYPPVNPDVDTQSETVEIENICDTKSHLNFLSTHGNKYQSTGEERYSDDDLENSDDLPYYPPPDIVSSPVHTTQDLDCRDEFYNQSDAQSNYESMSFNMDLEDYLSTDQNRGLAACSDSERKHGKRSRKQTLVADNFMYSNFKDEQQKSSSGTTTRKYRKRKNKQPTQRKRARLTKKQQNL